MIIYHMIVLQLNREDLDPTNFHEKINALTLK